MWKTIEDFPNYEVSNLGEVRNVKTGKILKPGYNQDGYAIVQLANDGIVKMKRIHRLVLTAFNPIENYNNFEVNHKDRNRRNNNLENLEWVTNQQNIQYRDKSDNPNRRTSKVKVEYLNGEIKIFNSMTDCAKFYNVHQTTIRDYIKSELTPQRKIQANFTLI